MKIHEITLFNNLNEIYDDEDSECIAWDDMMNELIDENAVFIMQGNVGRWNGNFKAGTVVYDIEDFFYKIGQDIQAWSITAKGKIITIIAAHHDGINLYKLKALNQAGLDLAAEYEDSCNYGVPESDRKFHTKLFNSRKYITNLKMFG